MKAIDKQTIQGLGRNETPYYGDSDISDLNKGDKEGMFTNPTSTLDIDPLPSKETVIPDMNGGSLIPNPINASDTFLINFEDIMMPGTKEDMSAPMNALPDPLPPKMPGLALKYNVAREYCGYSWTQWSSLPVGDKATCEYNFQAYKD